MSETSLQPILVSGVMPQTADLRVVSQQTAREQLSTNVVYLGQMEYFPVSTKLAQGSIVIRLNTKRLSERMRIRTINEVLKRLGDAE